MRLNIHVPDELHATVKARLPRLNLSALVQRALTAELECRHDALECSTCASSIDRQQLADVALSRFYSDACWDLDPLIRRGGTAEGAARILRDVAGRHAISAAARIPLPRPTRAERAANKVTPMPLEADSRAHHPTARRTA